MHHAASRQTVPASENGRVVFSLVLHLWISNRAKAGKLVSRLKEAGALQGYWLPRFNLDATLCDMVQGQTCEKDVARTGL